MKTIIHDLENLTLNDNNYILDSNNINHCIGCFNCWTSTPLKCIYNDKCMQSSTNLLKSDTLIIISKNNYGTYSSKVKKILERNISFVYPYFVVRNNEVHHKTRINKKLDFITIFYGNINNKEKKLLEELTNRNSINFNLKKTKILFLKDENEARRKLNEFIY